MQKFYSRLQIPFLGKITIDKRLREQSDKGKPACIDKIDSEISKKFIEIGKKIKKGDTIMIVEAMKTMNHVPSTSDGVVKEICVADGQPVEFGQTLVVLE